MTIFDEFIHYFYSGINVISFQCQLIEKDAAIFQIAQISARLNLPCYLWNLGHGTFKLVDPKSGSLIWTLTYKQKPEFSEVDHQSSLDNLLAVQNCQQTAPESEPAFFDFRSSFPDKVLDFLMHRVDPGFFILQDLHQFLEYQNPDDFDARIEIGRLISLVSNLSSFWANSISKFLVLLGTQGIELSTTLSAIIPELFNPLPDYEQNLAFLKNYLTEIEPTIDLSFVPQLALAAGGLSLSEIQMGIRLIKSQAVQIDSDLVNQMINFKISRFKAFNLAFIPAPNLKDFGGMDNIRIGIHQVKKSYTQVARELGISFPKGWLLVGPPGTGKTFVSKFCASILEFPMVSVDPAEIVARGASYLRFLIKRIEASAPVVVYFDELDKLFPEPGQSANFSQRQVLGFLLSWLQDKVSKTFVIATLNRLDCLPPELTRLGRFDVIFYVGFPQAGERKDILHLHLARFDARYAQGDPLTEKQWRLILNRTVNCTPAELSVLVEKAANKLFYEGQPIVIGVEELIAARVEINPLFFRDTNRLLHIQNIAKDVSTPASLPDVSIYAPELTNLWGKKIDPHSSQQ